MIRSKRRKKNARRPMITEPREQQEEVEDGGEENEMEDQDQEENADGEEEDNERNDLVVLAFIPVHFLMYFWSTYFVVLTFVVVISIQNIEQKRENQRKTMEAAGERTPPMRTILEDTVTFKDEIIKLEQINDHLDFSTAFNIYLEMTNIIHSVGLLLYAEELMVYPLLQISFYFYYRCNLVHTKLYKRFFSPFDVYEALLAELIFKYMSRYSFNDHIKFVTFVQCPNSLLIFPIFMALLQCITTSRHNTLYANERRLRREIREKYNRKVHLEKSF